LEMMRPEAACKTCCLVRIIETPKCEKENPCQVKEWRQRQVKNRI
jgi:hypothetical protein